MTRIMHLDDLSETYMELICEYLDIKSCVQLARSNKFYLKTINECERLWKHKLYSEVDEFGAYAQIEKERRMQLELYFGLRKVIASLSSHCWTQCKCVIGCYISMY